MLCDAIIFAFFDKNTSIYIQKFSGKTRIERAFIQDKPNHSLPIFVVLFQQSPTPQGRLQ